MKTKIFIFIFLLTGTAGGISLYAAKSNPMECFSPKKENRMAKIKKGDFYALLIPLCSFLILLTCLVLCYEKKQNSSNINSPHTVQPKKKSSIEPPPITIPKPNNIDKRSDINSPISNSNGHDSGYHKTLPVSSEEKEKMISYSQPKREISTNSGLYSDEESLEMEQTEQMKTFMDYQRRHVSTSPPSMDMDTKGLYSDVGQSSEDDGWFS